MKPSGQEKPRRRSPKTGALQGSRRDYVATAIISVMCAGAVASVWATAPARHSHLTPASSQADSAQDSYAVPRALTALPSEATPVKTLPADPWSPRPIIAEGLVISYKDTTVTAIDPDDGSTVWSYSRDVPLCSLAQAWGEVVMTYKTGRGCGDVIAVSASSGQYSATRSASASENVSPIMSNDRVGIVSNQRVELWRSDLVRTVEYGDVPIKQEAHLQPHEDCSITSALTRKDLLAVVDSCEGSSWLRLQKTTPEDSRQPEITQDIDLGNTTAHLVAVGQTGAAVAVNSPTPAIISFDAHGHEVARHEIPQAPEITNTAPLVADLTHYITWYHNHTLYLMRPDTLAVERELPDAVGTGISLGAHVAYPTAEGWTEIEPISGQVIRTVPIDRGGYTGFVSMGIAEPHIVEKRGDQVVIFRQ
ncbi:hypothetical protein CIP103987_00548 [Corynebacterium diphtheriae]|nr:hypothetical protein CIP103987_00548 [Corynebacterium diphtheriae]